MSKLVYFFLLFAFSLLTMGQTWLQTNIHPSGVSINDLALTRNNNLLTGAEGIFSSSDFGNTWNISSPFNYGIESILSTDNAIFTSTLFEGLWRSANEGESWEKLTSGMTSDWIISIAWDSSNGNIYAGGPGQTAFTNAFFRSFDNGTTWEFCATPLDFNGIRALAVSSQGYIFAGGNDGLIKSTDYGTTWFNIGQSVINYPILKININDYNEIYLGVIYQGIFRSTDLGTTWEQRNNGIENLTVSEIAFSTNSIFVGTQNGIFQSTNNGEIWEPSGLQQVGVKALLVLNNEKIIAGTNGCYIYESTDEGNSWAEIGKNGMLADGILSMAVIDDHKIIAGSNWRRIYITSDHGNHWIRSNFAPNQFPSILCHPEGRIFAASMAEGVFCSTDTCKSWFPINSGLTTNDTRALTLDSSNILYIGTFGSGIFKSDDYGEHWTPCNNGLTSLNIVSLATAPNGAIFAGSYDHGAFKSTNGGDIWLPINGPFVYDIVRCFLFPPSGYYYLGTLYGVYLSTDNGLTWNSFNFNLSEFNVNSLIYLGGNSILAATWEGMYIYDPQASQWNSLNTGLKNITIYSMTKTSDGIVFLGSSRGVYRSNESLTLIEDNLLVNPNRFILYQNYPNPFNNSTDIIFSVSSAASVKIEVYDMLGNYITTLVNENKSVGYYKVQFNANNLPTGIYFYRMISGNYIETKKMILLK